MDFRATIGNYQYGVRVTAIIIEEGKLLTYKVDNQNHLIGGAIEVGESSIDAVSREVKEELGLECVVKDLMFIVENKFDYEGELHHMIEFHYKVELMGKIPQVTIDEHAYECEWINLHEIECYDIRPKFLKVELKNNLNTIKHIDITLSKA